MNCGEIKDLIIEYNGKIDGAKIGSGLAAEINAHLASCAACASVQQRMLDMNASIASDKIDIPANLAAEIISRVIPAAERAKPKIKTFSRPEPGFIEKIAEFLGITPGNLAFAMPVIILAAAALGMLIYSYGLKSADSPDKLAEVKKFEVNETINPAKDQAEKKFKKINDDSQKTLAAAGEEVEKKFKKNIFTVERGAVANFSGEYKNDETYQVKSDEDLVINYKKVAELIIKTDSKFKINDDGIILESGMVSVDLKPKSLSKFSVVTPESVVEVVGTVFSVASSNGKTEVSVKNGCVKVTDLKTKESSLLTAGGSKIISSSAEVKKIDETAPVIIEYGAGINGGPDDKASKAGAAAKGAEKSGEAVHVTEVNTAPVQIEGANIKDVINKFKNEIK